MTFNNIDDLLTDIQQEIEAETINDNDKFELYINDELLFVGSNHKQFTLFVKFILNEKARKMECDYEIMLDQIRVYLWAED